MRAYLLFGISILFLLSGCGTLATPVPRSASSTDDVQVRTSGTQVADLASETPLIPTSTATATASPTDTPAPTQTSTPAPTNTLVEPTQETLTGDAVNGEVLFNTFQAEASFACSTCHFVNSEDRLIGPGLLNVGSRAETRVDGLAARQYIFESIVDPSAFVVPDYPDGLMPQNWASIYTDDEIYDIIAYLLTLQN